MTGWERLAAAATPVAATPASVSARLYLTPHDAAGSPLAALLAVIAGARHTVDFGAYSFTRNEVTDALAAARARGVRVRGVLDLSQSVASGGEAPRLKAAGVDFRLYGGPGTIFHAKVLVADAAYPRFAALVSGSYNWSTAAETSNREVMTVLTGTAVSKVLAPPLLAMIDDAYGNGATP